MSENVNQTNLFGQYVPAGSYQNSSSNISVTINAQCKRFDGGVIPSTLTFTTDVAVVIDDIENRDGKLLMLAGKDPSQPNPTNLFGQYVPAGSYQNSSSDISITLNAACEQTGGNVVQSPALTFLATDVTTISDIENREGTLKIINA